MMLARGFFVISVLAVLSSASAGFIAPPAQGEPTQKGVSPPAQEPYYGPSQFA
ncbi:MAG: hypothetical protein AB1592_06650 [Pseudomonadota bacterium]